MNLNSLYLKVKWFVSLFWGLNWTGEIVAGWEDGHFCDFHFACVFDVWGAWFPFIRHEFSVFVYGNCWRSRSGACNWGSGGCIPNSLSFLDLYDIGMLLHVWWGSGQVLGIWDPWGYKNRNENVGFITRPESQKREWKIRVDELIIQLCQRCTNLEGKRWMCKWH